MTILCHDLVRSVCFVDDVVSRLRLEPSREEQKALLDDLDVVALMMRRLVMNCSLLGPHSLTPAPATTHLQQLVRDFLEISTKLRTYYRQDETALSVSVPDDLTLAPLSVACDKFLFGVCVVNLADNAFRHSAPGRMVSAKCRIIDMIAQFEFSNMIAGDPDVDVLRWYELGVSRRDSLGLGIGLHVARLVCEAHSWSLDLTSSGDLVTARLGVPINAPNRSNR